MPFLARFFSFSVLISSRSPIFFFTKHDAVSVELSPTSRFARCPLTGTAGPSTTTLGGPSPFPPSTVIGRAAPPNLPDR
ncbi:hypothetical protein LY76DRAFT_588447 [Colletotrichum caudatum]|nr:hypothetical protein LY76DRAFT_588447 [Colletotrichum caudatum]